MRKSYYNQIGDIGVRGLVDILVKPQSKIERLTLEGQITINQAIEFRINMNQNIDELYSLRMITNNKLYPSLALANDVMFNIAMIHNKDLRQQARYLEKYLGISFDDLIKPFLNKGPSTSIRVTSVMETQEVHRSKIN